MNLFKRIKSNSTGFAIHSIFPVLVVAVIAIIGVRVITASHAATPNGITYYVSPSGNDSNNGTSTSTPWKTINGVNSHKFIAGQTISFLGGATFSGQLYFSSGETGTSTSPITVNSYGSGQATINGGTTSAIYVYNTAGYNIDNLNLVGSGASTSNSAGIYFWNYSDGTLNYINVNDVSVSGFKKGLSIGATAAGTGFSNVTVSDSSFYSNKDDGMDTWGPTFNSSSPTYAVSNIFVINVTAYNNLGDSTLTGSNDSGNGVVLGSANGATIEYSTAYNNGANCVDSACGVGLWAYDSNNVTIQHDLSYDNNTGGKADGDGFDLDQNTSNSVMQYNYSYNNQGSGYLLFGESTDNSHTGNTVRFNISQNDGRKNGSSGITLYGNVINDNIYNNTVYTSPSSSGKPFDLEVYSGANGVTIRNNIFYATGGLYPVYVAFSAPTTAIDMQSNDYYNFDVYWNTTNYTSLASWQSATGQERLKGISTGSSANPGLVNAGSGTLITNESNLASVTQYKLASGSVMKNAGINLASQFNTNMGGIDFYGVTVPTSAGLSIGAAE